MDVKANVTLLHKKALMLEEALFLEVKLGIS